MKLPPAALLGVALSAFAAFPAGAIIMRHDRSDAAYVALGAKLTAYCRLNAPDGGGVLVAPRWVLTAAHLTGDLKLPQTIECGGETLKVVRVVNHPGWDQKKNDIALLELAAPAQGVQPVELWRRTDEAGRVVNLVGHYQGGTGLTGSDPKVELKLRGATNRIDAADKLWLRFHMDPPGSPNVTDMEGVSGGGDSGAPAWLEEGGKTYVIGVGSHSRDLNGDGKEPDYGDEDVYARVSTYAGWIDQTISAAAEQERPGQSGGFGQRPWCP